MMSTRSMLDKIFQDLKSPQSANHHTAILKDYDETKFYFFCS